MKRHIFLLFVFIFIFNTCFSQNSSYSPPFLKYTPIEKQYPAIGNKYSPIEKKDISITRRNLSYLVLEDGFYKAKVKYMHSNGNRAIYTLAVKIQEDVITSIYFDNGGVIHTGYNKYGYDYLGGGICFQKDYSGEIGSAYAKILVIYDNHSWQHFTIYL